MHVVVVGGGIVGLSCAHALAERDIEVTLCERGTVGGESTQRSAGGIRTQFATCVNVDLSLASLEIWSEFEERFDVDIAHRKTGYLFLTREERTATEFEENVTLQNERGGNSTYLDPGEATAYAPGIHPEEFAAATYSPLDGFADPNLAAQGYAQALGDGVTVLTKTPVEDVIVENGTVCGVETPDERIGAEVVIDAAGAWAGRLGAMAGVSLPIEPKRRQILIANPETPVSEDAPLTIDLDTGLYFRPEREEQALVGGYFGDADPTQDPGSYDKTMDFDWATAALENASGWTDYFGPETTVKRGWAGLYAVTPDHHPIIEESMPGLVVAAGFSGHGFQHAPATGQLVAEIVHDGTPSLVDIDVLGSDRFEEEGLQEETNVA